MKILEKKEPKQFEFKQQEQLTDRNVQMSKAELKMPVQVKKEVYKRPDFLYQLL